MRPFELLKFAEEAITFLKKINSPQGPSMQEIHGGVQNLLGFMESFPAPKGHGHSQIFANRAASLNL